MTAAGSETRISCSNSTGFVSAGVCDISFKREKKKSEKGEWCPRRRKYLQEDKHLRFQHKFHQSIGILHSSKDTHRHWQHKFRSHTEKKEKKKKHQKGIERKGRKLYLNSVGRTSIEGSAFTQRSDTDSIRTHII